MSEKTFYPVQLNEEQVVSENDWVFVLCPQTGGSDCLEGHKNTLMKDTAEPNNICASMTNQYLWRETEVAEEMRFQLQSEW